MREHKSKITLSLFALTTAILAGCIILPAAHSQETTTDFSQTFQIFSQNREAFRTFDISPDDVVYSLPPTYALGPGDILQVIMTGMINDSLPIQVGPQGDIYVPPVGLIKIEGMTVPDARDYIDSQLSKYLINYELSLQLMKARRITVYFLGQVRQPGTYISLAGTTALSLVQTAGSLITNPVTINPDETEIMHPYFRALTSGAGRWLQVWREGELVTELDLAKVAVSGDSQDDVVLEDGDALFVPANIHPVVVRGGVARPGTYEFADGDTVLDLLAQAGGYRSMMMLDKVAVERAASPGSVNPTEVVLDLRDPSFDPQSFAFQPGDILRVPEVKQQVYVLGAVVMPQAVDYHEGWNALDYLAATGGPIAGTDTAGMRIISLPLDPNQRELRFDFKNLLLGDVVETAPIQPGDMIYVPWKNQPFYGTGLTGTIAGFIAQTVGLLRLFGGD